jgi:2-polyprenyl-6-methoxyphenol hydroxylase-like FAD-dependent oxidoreductase
VTDPVEVLVVGAGPTGLTLAAQLRAFGTRFRLIDRQLDRVHESRGARRATEDPRLPGTDAVVMTT